MWRKQKIRDRRRHDFDRQKEKERDSIALHACVQCMRERVCVRVVCACAVSGAFVLFPSDNMRRVTPCAIYSTENNPTITLIIIIT